MTKDSKNDIPNITMRMQSDFSKVDTVMCAMSKGASYNLLSYLSSTKKIVKSTISYSVLMEEKTREIEYALYSLISRNFCEKMV